jgi:hypothetical protein
MPKRKFINNHGGNSRASGVGVRMIPQPDEPEQGRDFTATIRNKSWLE